MNGTSGSWGDADTDQCSGTLLGTAFVRNRLACSAICSSYNAGCAQFTNFCAIGHTSCNDGRGLCECKSTTADMSLNEGIVYAVACAPGTGPADSGPSTGMTPYFSVNEDSGQVSTLVALNFEAFDTFTLILRVADGGTPSLFSEAPVIISVVNVNEPPVVENAARSVSENSLRTTKVGEPIFARRPGQHCPWEPTHSRSSNSLFKILATDNASMVTTLAYRNEFKVGACSGQIEVKQSWPPGL